MSQNILANYLALNEVKKWIILQKWLGPTNSTFFAVVRRRVGHGNHRGQSFHDANSKLLFKERQMKLEKGRVLENREVVPLLEFNF